jgi:hypothetical protein
MSAPPTSTRRDGWTAERQLRFLDTLGRTRSVTSAARATGMSRESAYRLRARSAGALFALLWDRAMQPPLRRFESHTDAMGNGALMRAWARILGANAGISTASARTAPKRANADRTGTSRPWVQPHEKGAAPGGPFHLQAS